MRIRLLLTGLMVLGLASPAVASPLDDIVWPGNRTGAAWGLNSSGQVGDATWTDRTLPVGVYGLSHVAEVAAGRLHSLAIMNDRTLRTWGANGSGQLGWGFWVPSSVPRPVPGLSNVVDAAGGWTHSLAVTADGTVWAWGDNQSGQLGDGTTNQRFSPVRLSGLSGAIAVAAGNGWSLALTADGSVWAWGTHAHGVLGLAAQSSVSLTPIRVTGLSNVVAIAAGAQHAMAIVNDSGVQSAWAWGQNAVGQLGRPRCAGIICGSPIPARVAGLPGIVAIAAGDLTSVALGSDGSVWTWGSNGSGALGSGTNVGFRIEPGVAIGSRGGIVGIAAGGTHVMVVRADGIGFGWGSNRHGEIGNGTIAPESGIVQVPNLIDVKQVAAGQNHTIAIYLNSSIMPPREP